MITEEELLELVEKVKEDRLLIFKILSILQEKEILTQDQTKLLKAEATNKLASWIPTREYIPDKGCFVDFYRCSKCNESAIYDSLSTCPSCGSVMR